MYNKYFFQLIVYLNISCFLEYGFSTIAVFLICLTALPGMLFAHFTRDKASTRYRMVMSVMIGLAIGSLFADALLHLIPAVSA